MNGGKKGYSEGWMEVKIEYVMKDTYCTVEEYM